MNGVRVLAIDGGGIRGVIPALVLTELERRAGRRIFEMFDLIAGTSTGGILACALCAPDPLPASDLVELYTKEGPKIFETTLRGRPVTLYNDTVVAYGEQGEEIFRTTVEEPVHVRPPEHQNSI